ncbi:Ppx/GppA phosphatase family protein [Dysosmobacter sp.]
MKYAIVDLGSNTIRLSVYNTLPGGGFELLFSEKEMAGLVNYLSDGVLSGEGIQRACRALLDFQALARQFGMEELQVFATASLRNIRNTAEAVEAIRRETGLEVDVVSGGREAELGYYGALRTMDLRTGAMFDIGGGSTEIVEVREGRILRAQSLPVGSLNLFSRHVKKIWPKRGELDAIRETVAKTLASAELPSERAERVCGVGGTARAVLKIANVWYGRPAMERRLTPRQLHKLAGALLRRDEKARKLILNACPDRIHTILPGLMMMDALCGALCEKELYISQYGVREGYLCHKLLSRT